MALGAIGVRPERHIDAGHINCRVLSAVGLSLTVRHDMQVVHEDTAAIILLGIVRFADCQTFHIACAGHVDRVALPIWCGQPGSIA